MKKRLIEQGNLNFETTGIKNGQVTVLLLSILFFVTFMISLISDFSYSMLSLLLIETAASIVINLYFKNIFDTKIEGGILHIENLWCREKITLNESWFVRPYNFVFPYPLNPFIVFQSGTKKIITQIPNVTKVYFTKDGLVSFISELNKRIQELQKHEI